MPWALTFSASSTLTVAARRPSTSAYRNGSMMFAGVAWNMSGRRAGAP